MLKNLLGEWVLIGILMYISGSVLWILFLNNGISLILQKHLSKVCMLFGGGTIDIIMKVILLIRS